MNGRLKDKVAIVTASTDGIGLAIAERLAKDGAKVIISSRKLKNVDNAVAALRNKGLTVSGVVCHVGNKTQRDNLIKKTIEEFGGIDILVNNAAANPIFGPILDVLGTSYLPVLKKGRFKEITVRHKAMMTMPRFKIFLVKMTTEAAWDKIFEINVKSAFFMTKEVVQHMENRGGGAVVFVSSLAGYVPAELMGAYGISKTAMLGMVKALVPQLASKNIRVYGIAPSVIETRFSDALWNSPVSEEVKNSIPMKRFGKPEECAGVVSFLVSEDASYMTGETIVIDGGSPSRL